MDMNDFSTLDRLKDFSLSTDMTQQMTETMNEVMQSMQLPELSKPLKQKRKEWYVAIDCKAFGPVSENDIKKLYLDRKITNESLVWCFGMQEWQQVQNIPSMLSILNQLPPAL